MPVVEKKASVLRVKMQCTCYRHSNSITEKLLYSSKVFSFIGVKVTLLFNTLCVSVITLYISYFMLYIYNIEERHKHNDFKLPRAPNWQLVGGLGG